MNSARAGLPEPETRHRALVLIEIEVALGHEWRWRRGQLTNPVVEGDFVRVEQVLSTPPSTSAKVAWFAFANAHIPRGHLRLGQVQFFSHEIWPEMVRDEAALLRSYPDAEFPAELDDRHTSYMSASRPDANAEEQRAAATKENRVFARVELAGERAAETRNPWAHTAPPDHWARNLVVGIVEAASFRWGESAWNLLDGVAVYHGDDIERGERFPNWSGTLGFRDPEVFRRNRMEMPHREPTGHALRELPSSFADRAAAGDSTVEDAVAELRWYQSARAQTDPAQRLALYVRAFERALPLAENELWYDAVRRYFRDFWVRSAFDVDLRELASATDHFARTHDFERLRSLGEWVVSDGHRGSTNIRAFFERVAEVEALLPRDQRILRRRVREAVKWATDPGEARLRHTLYERHFDTVLNRAVRQRNAVIHGVRTVPEVVATAEPLIGQIAAFLVSN